RLHVDFVERGEDGGGRLRLHQALGDARPQAAHRHALLGAVPQNLLDAHRSGRLGQGGLRRCGRLRRRRALRPEHIVFRDAAAAAAPAAPAFPSVSIVAMTSPALTVPPSPLMIFESTPSAGAGSSSTTLSVSMSIRFSSRLTASPTFLCHASKVASATDSESCGTLISMSMLFLLES